MILQKIGEVEIAGEKFDLAKNSNHYHLVDTSKIDSYGKPISNKIPLKDVLVGDRVQALLDLLGDALVRLGQQRDARLGRGEGRDD